jgi:hypothetical protein
MSTTFMKRVETPGLETKAAIVGRFFEVKAEDLP